ncbi:hypothetical protein [Bacillus mycoides]
MKKAANLFKNPKKQSTFKLPQDSRSHQLIQENLQLLQQIKQRIAGR